MNVPQLRFKGFEREWDSKNLGDVCKIQTGNKDTVNKVENGKYPFYVRSQTVERINSYSYDGEAILTAGDGVGVGKVFHYVNGKFDYHQRVYMLNNFEEVDGKFIFFLFKEKFLKEAMKYNAKTSVDSVRREMITKMTLHIPDIKEQKKISSFLTLLEYKIEKQQEKIEKLEQFKKGMMQKIFSQELRFKDEDGGEFPEWKRFKLGDIAIIKGRLGWKGLKQEEYVENGAYLVAGKHIHKGIIQWDKCDQITDFRYQESIEIALEENDVIFSKDGSLGNPAIVKSLPKEATINSTMMLIRMTGEVIPDYLYQVLLGADFKRLIHLKVSGSSIPHLFQADMKEFEFLAPTSVKEQEKITGVLNNLDVKIRKENEKLLALEKQKQAFIQNIFI